MNEIFAGDVSRSERLLRWVHKQIEIVQSPRTKRFWTKLPYFVFGRAIYTGVMGGFLIGIIVGVLSPLVHGWWIAFLMVLGWLGLALVVCGTTHISMLWARVDWYQGWRASHYLGKDFWDNPNDWVTKEEYDEEYDW